jgi:hypothetical protein
MNAIAIRYAVVLAAQLAAVEVLLRLSVHRPESWEERWLLWWCIGSLAGITSAVLPVIAPGFRIVRCAALILVFAVASFTAANVYSWHVRPNLGFYDEPNWVAQFPEFYRQQRERIEANRW